MEARDNHLEIENAFNPFKKKKKNAFNAYMFYLQNVLPLSEWSFVCFFLLLLVVFLSF